MTLFKPLTPTKAQFSKYSHTESEDFSIGILADVGFGGGNATIQPISRVLACETEKPTLAHGRSNT